MKASTKVIPVLFLFASTFFLCSCESIKPVILRLGTALQSKHCKEVFNENEALKQEYEKLSAINMKLIEDTLLLGQQIRQSDSSYQVLTEKYNKPTTSGMQLAIISASLDEKAKELNRREGMIDANEQRLKERYTKELIQDSVLQDLMINLRKVLIGFQAEELNLSLSNEKLYVSLSNQFFFKPNTATIEEQGKELLRKLASVLNKNQLFDISIESYEDSVFVKNALYKDGWDLGIARATHIVRVLSHDFKISPARLTACGKGEYFPAISSSTSEEKLRNYGTAIVLSIR